MTERKKISKRKPCRERRSPKQMSWEALKNRYKGRKMKEGVLRGNAGLVGGFE